MNNAANYTSIATSALNAFNAGCLDRMVCLAWLENALHRGVARCPSCMAKVADKQLARWKAFERLQCPDCGKFYTAATGTWVAGAKLEANQIFVLAALVAMKVDRPLIAAAIGISEVTVRYWVDKFAAIEAIA